MRPHLVFLTCHDLGRFLGCYGVSTVHSPNLDRMAAEGVRFSRSFAVSPGCSPSRAAMATGRFPHSNGVMGLAHHPFDWDLNPDEKPISHLMRSHGYETHLFGLQHIAVDTGRLDFEFVHPFMGKAWGQTIQEQVVAFLAGGVPARPLYLEINLEEPHRPYDQGGATPDESSGVTVPAYLPHIPESRQEMAALQGAIRQADRAVGEVLDALDRAGMHQNTWVVFATDHGIAMPRAKGTLYDPGIEQALIMRWPAAGLQGATSIDEMVSNVDILPTLLEGLDIPLPPEIQGRSFWPLLQGRSYVPRTEVQAEKTFHSYYDPMRAVRTERFKYIRNFEQAFGVEIPGDVERGAIFGAAVVETHVGEHAPAELYDLDADPSEMHNLAGDPDFEEVEQWLDMRLWTWMSETDDPLLHGPIPSPTYRRVMAQAPAGIVAESDSIRE